MEEKEEEEKAKEDEEEDWGAGHNLTKSFWSCMSVILFYTRENIDKMIMIPIYPGST